MQNYKLLHDHPDHFLLTNGKAHFKVAKSGIDQPTADKIRSFADGGTIQTPYEAGIEAKEKNIRATPTQSPDEAQIEGAEKNRRAQPAKDYIQENNPGLKDTENPLNLAEGGKLAANAYNGANGTPADQEVKARTTADPYANFANAATQGSITPQQIEAGARSIDRSPASEPIENKAKGGPIQSNAVQDISHETQSQAIGRYAAGNPANLAQGGKIPSPTGNVQDQGGQFPWHRNGKYHFHFYDGAVIPTPLDKEEGAGPQQPSALDKYVGGEPAQGTPLDNYAEGGDVAASSEGDKLEQAAQSLQAGLNSQTAPAPADMQDNAPASSSEGTYSESTQSTIPQAQQIPAMQKTLPPTPDQSPTMLSDLDKSLALEKSGIEQGAQAQSEGYKQTANAVGQQVLQQKAQMDAYKLASDNLTAQNTQLFNSVASSKIDPNHFWNSKTTGGKIMATIGLILGGIGGGLNGTNQNQALITMQNHIQQDIEAQKNDQSNKMNLYKMGLEKYRDAQSAQQFATLQSNALLQGQLQKIAAQTGSQQARATAQQMIGQIGVQNTGLRSELAMKQAAFGAMNQPQPAQAGVDPNKMRLLINAGVIPKEEVPTAMKEYSDYTKLSDTLDHTDDVFKQAAANSTYSERALPGWTPTLRDKSKQYEAVTDAWLGNITKDTEGRVTPADIQLMKASLPKAGDSPQLIQTKLANIKDMIRQKYAFPTLQSYRLLGPNNAVSTPAATRQKRFTESAPK